MEERLGFIVENRTDLLHKLDSYVRDPDALEQACHGRLATGRRLDAFSEDEHLARALEAWIEEKNLYRLLEHWVQGLAIDWARLYPNPAPLPISLPFYAFDPQSYRLPEVVHREVAQSETASAAIPSAREQETKDASVSERHMFRPVWKAKPVLETES